MLDVALPLLLTNNDKPFVVQVGASDGVTGDPLNHLIKRHHLRGLLIEPLPGPFELLRRNYEGCEGLAFVNAAISGSDGEIELYVSDGAENAIHISQKASLLPQMPSRHFKRRPLMCLRVPSVTVSTLIETHKVGRIDLLQIDTEGYDFEIIQQFFNAGHKPRIIHFESLHLNRKDMTECRSLLSREGYQYVETTVNTLAVKLPDLDTAMA
ncbi:MAG: FkbM family methyltransferase [Kiritimatiellia bacterium]